MKAIGQDGTSTNTSGFSVMLAGSRGDDGYFYDLGYYTYFWSSTEGSTMGAYTLDLYGSESYVNLGYYHKGPGFGIRCVKD